MRRSNIAVDARTRLEQLTSVGVLRAIEHIENRCLLHRFAVVQHRHAIGNLTDHPPSWLTQTTAAPKSRCSCLTSSMI